MPNPSRVPRRVPLTAAAAAAFILLLAIVAAVSGCARGVAFGPAGEPAGSFQATWLRFTLETDPAGSALARFYAEQFATVGVRASVEVDTRDRLVERARRGEADAVLAGWAGWSPEPLAMAVAKLTPDGAENFSGYDCPELGRELGCLVTLKTEDERQAVARAAQETLYEEAPWVFGVSCRLFDAAAASLQGWRSGPAGAVSLHDADLAAGERLTVGLGLEERPAIDPLGPIDPQAGTIYRCLFEALAAVGPDGKLVPELAEAWEFSANARRLTVQLRAGVTFHNGDPLRPADVVFTYEQVLPGRLPAGLDVKVSALGPDTVAFDFDHPFPGFLDLFGLQPIVPASYYQSAGPAGFSEAPVGTGPFRYNPATQTRQFVLCRWGGYWGGAPALEPRGTAHLDEVAFVFVPDPGRRLAMLENGQIALAPALWPGVAESFRGLGGAVVREEPGWLVLALELNTRGSPFADTRVRLALNFALDRQALAAAVGSGATVLPGAFLPEGSGYSADAGTFSLDRERARAYLEDAGYLVSVPGGS